jgi:hypothetical protein
VAGKQPIELDFRTVPGASDYRVLVRDDNLGVVCVKAVVERPPYQVADLDPGTRYRWRVQHRLTPGSSWLDGGPYIGLRIAPPTGPTLRLTWPRSEEDLAYRILIHDDTSGERVMDESSYKDEYLVDCADLNPTHNYRYRTQRYVSDGWVDMDGYAPLPTVGSPAVTAEAVPRSPEGAAAIKRVLLVTVDTEASLRAMREPDARAAVDQLIFGDFADPGPRGAGIGLHMDILERHEVRGCFFLDILLEFEFGRAGTERAIAEIQGRGHEVQLHLHPNHLAHASDPRVSSLAGVLHRPNRDELLRVMEIATSLFSERAGVPPVAFRAGGHQLSPELLEMLPEFGIKIDASLHTLQSRRMPAWMRSHTQPFRWRGVLMIPASWGARRMDDGQWGQEPLSIWESRKPEPYLERQSLGADEPSCTVFASNSYALLTSSREHGPETLQRWTEELVSRNPAELSDYARSLDESFVFAEASLEHARVDSMDRFLAIATRPPGLRAMTFAEVHQAGLWSAEARRSIDPLPTWSDQAEGSLPAVTQLYTADFRRSLLQRRPASTILSPSRSPRPALVPWLAQIPVEWERARVLAWSSAPEELAPALRSLGVSEPSVLVDTTSPVVDPSAAPARREPARFEPINALRFDVILMIDVLERLMPSDGLDSLVWCQAHLEPGGLAIVRADTFFAAGDANGLAHEHVLFSGPTLREAATIAAPAPAPLCAATYMTMFRRAGYEFVELERLLRPDDEAMSEDADRLRFLDPLEARTEGLLAILRAPLSTSVERLRLVGTATA